MIHYHISEEEEMHLSLLSCWFFFFFTVFLPSFFLFFSLKNPREVSLGRETGDTADTSSTSMSLIHCRVPSTRQMPLSNVRIDQCKSVTIVPHQLSLHTEKP